MVAYRAKAEVPLSSSPPVKPETPSSGQMLQDKKNRAIFTKKKRNAEQDDEIKPTDFKDSGSKNTVRC